ncbi:MAG: alpha/beta hydrolase [Ectothiorhodospiraceae bacterium]|nr:alpha/beta hydrolase [Chromatiales bacterium]MCP5153634.1 alpha/beta hydrolase [Ectothiorhodospiraceae bacterium]
MSRVRCKPLIEVVLLAVAVYAIVCGAAWWLQDRLVYFPSRTVAWTPAAAGLDYRDVWLDADGERLHGWFVPGPIGDHGPTPVVLFLHGNAGNLGDRIETLAVLHRTGAAVLAIDYRGYGQSEGEPGEAATYADAHAAWRWLLAAGHPPQRIVVMGRSLGGGVASWLAAHEPVGGLVLENTFTSVAALGAEVYPWLPVRWLARIRYDSLARMPAVSAPVLIAHARADMVVPFRHGRALLDATTAPKRFLELDGGHDDAFLATGERYVEALRAFLSEVAETSVASDVSRPPDVPPPR